MTFLLALKNPHTVPARKFTLASEQKHQAMMLDMVHSLVQWI
jgi:hypothetical protein